MFIEFKIHFDGKGGASVVPTPADAPQTSPAEKLLGPKYIPPAQGLSLLANAQGIGQPPTPGLGMVFVVGPIVVCGSGPGHSHTGGGVVGASVSGPPADPPTTGSPEAQPENGRKKGAVKRPQPPKK